MSIAANSWTKCIIIVAAFFLAIPVATAQDNTNEDNPRRRSEPRDDKERGVGGTAETNYEKSGPSSGSSSKNGRSLKVGVGLGGGTLASGLSARFYMDDTSAIQGVVGTWRSYGFGASIDYIKEVAVLAEGPSGDLRAHIGGGVGLMNYNVGIASVTFFGLSGVGGLGYHFSQVPLEISAEWRPTYLIGETVFGSVGGLRLDGGGGAIRWYF